MQSYKRDRTRLVLRDYVRLTPRNGKYTATTRAERVAFESSLLSMLSGRRKKEPLQPSG